MKRVGGLVLVGAVDGLGRGPEAAAAARAAIEALDRQNGASVPELFAASHQALVGKRGAVMSLALVDPEAGSLVWAGVGNVAGVLLQRGPPPAACGLATRGGIVGGELPKIEPRTVTLSGDDTLIFATDGVRGGFADNLSPGDDPQRTASDLLARYGREDDDALVLVVRFARSRAS